MFARTKLAKAKVVPSSPHAFLCASTTLNWSLENARACERKGEGGVQKNLDQCLQSLSIVRNDAVRH